MVRMFGSYGLWARCARVMALVTGVGGAAGCVGEQYHIVNPPHPKCLPSLPAQLEKQLKLLEQNCRDNEGTPSRWVRWGKICDAGGRRLNVGMMCSGAFLDDEVIANMRKSPADIAFAPRLRPRFRPRPPSTVQPKSKAELIKETLAAHNKYRTPLGLPPLTWSDTLAEHAAAWARHLAATSTFVHAKQTGEGENLWMGTKGHYTRTQMVDSWGAEKQHFVYGNFPNVSSTGKWQDVGHYTAMIWRTTTEVGCALVPGVKYDYYVCRYSPQGNWMGQKPY